MQGNNSTSLTAQSSTLQLFPLYTDGTSERWQKGPSYEDVEQLELSYIVGMSSGRTIWKKEFEYFL